MPVAIRNQQRLHKVASARLKQLAQHVLDILAVGKDESVAANRIRGSAARREEASRLQRTRRTSSKANLSLVLVNDATIQKLNREFHQTDTPTDVLSFDYGNDELEVIVSVERAVAVAEQYRNTPSRELALYVIHGILHLHGYDDLTPAKRRKMRAAERRFMVLCFD